jgi:hypothetical protein
MNPFHLFKGHGRGRRNQWPGHPQQEVNYTAHSNASSASKDTNEEQIQVLQDVDLHESIADTHGEIFSDHVDGNAVSASADLGYVTQYGDPPQGHGRSKMPHRHSDSTTESGAWSSAMSAAASACSGSSCGIGTGYADEDDKFDEDDLMFISDEHDIEPLPFYSGHADTVIAQQLSRLTMREREQVYYDLHGVRDEAPETPMLLYEAVEKMKQQLQQVVAQGAAVAYEQAVQQNPFYCHKTGFLTKFLRAESLDPSQAALRIARYFDNKLELFGADKLTKDITQDDFEGGANDTDTLYNGQLQILPERDRAGRAIAICTPAARTTGSSLSMLRRLFYLAQLISEDEETQKKGVIVVCVYNHCTPDFDTAYAQRAAIAGSSQPVRIEALHFCMDNSTPGWGPFFDAAKMAMNPYLQVRVKSHVGDFHECMSALRSFGIPTKEFPMKVISNIGSNDSTGLEMIVDVDHHVEMMKKRREREQRYHSLISMVASPRRPQRSSSIASSSSSGYDPSLGDSQGSQDMAIPSSVSFIPEGVASSSNTMELMPQGLSQHRFSATSVLSSVEAQNPQSSSSMGMQQAKKKKSKFKHSAFSSVAGVCVPSRNDVLFGRGKRYQNHIGNQRFRKLIDDCLSTYDKASKEQKTKIAQEIVGIVHQARGRFLKDDGAGWVQVTDLHTLRQKVAHAFRGLRSQKQMQASQAAKAAARRDQAGFSGPI